MDLSFEFKRKKHTQVGYTFYGLLYDLRSPLNLIMSFDLSFILKKKNTHVRYTFYGPLYDLHSPLNLIMSFKARETPLRFFSVKL